MAYPSYSQRWWTALYALAVLSAIIFIWDSDYRAARELECGNRSTNQYTVYWDSMTDTCKKDYQNGQATQNRSTR